MQTWTLLRSRCSASSPFVCLLVIGAVAVTGLAGAAVCIATPRLTKTTSCIAHVSDEKLRNAAALRAVLSAIAATFSAIVLRDVYLRAALPCDPQPSPRIVDAGTALEAPLLSAVSPPPLDRPGACLLPIQQRARPCEALDVLSESTACAAIMSPCQQPSLSPIGQLCVHGLIPAPPP
jgi:hypothetical protein